MYEAIILAGGFGTRLREAVPDLPKPMAPIAHQPFLAWQLDYLMKMGVGRFILSVGYKANVIRDYFGSHYKGASIVYVEESTPLGTGGAIAYALKAATQDRVFIFNGDTLCDVNLDRLRASTFSKDNAIGILVKHVADTGRYGAISFDNESRLVTSFGEKQASGQGFINAGIYDVPKNLFDNIQIAPPFSFETHVIPQVVGNSLYAEFSGEFFIDIGIKEDFINAQHAVPLFIENALI